MSKRDKRLDKIRNSPREVTPDELYVVLGDRGFMVRGGKGSHRVVTLSGTPIVFTLAERTPLKRVYVQAALDAIEEAESLGFERGFDL